jgi:hypothetical protein
LQELFPVLVRRIVHTSSAAQELRLFLELLFICVTLSCSALHVHRLGVAHQSLQSYCCFPHFLNDWFHKKFFLSFVVSEVGPH